MVVVVACLRKLAACRLDFNGLGRLLIMGSQRQPQAPAGSPRPRWLDADEQRAWRSYLRAVKLLDEALRRGLEAHDLNHPEYEILVRLSESPQRQCRMAELAGEVVSSRSRLTHTVTRLERKGWVERRPCADDGRGVLCVLTADGFTALERAAVTHVEGVRSLLLDPLSREQFLALGDSLETVAQRIHLAEG